MSSSASLLHGAAPDLLFLAPGLPYPLDCRHRLRWYHMLKFLGRHYRVHLGCFADPRRANRAHLGRIQALCHETCFVAAPPAATRLHTLACGPALDLSACQHPALADWLARLARRVPLAGALACSVRMAPYLAGVSGVAGVIDFVELESERQRVAAAGLRWPRSALWRRQAARLLARERALAAHASHVLFASSGQAALFQALAPESRHKALVLPNGVDSDHFSPHIVHRNPYPAGARVLVFAGAMDDPANATAADWFARQVFAALRDADPALRFFVVGALPSARVRALGRLRGVTVTGAVPDPRPYLAHAALALAPLQAAQERQDEVLEAMAMQTRVLAIPDASAGPGALAGGAPQAADGAKQFAGQVRTALANGDGAPARAARARVLRDDHWPARLAPLAPLFQDAPLRASAT